MKRVFLVLLMMSSVSVFANDSLENEISEHVSECSEEIEQDVRHREQRLNQPGLSNKEKNQLLEEEAIVTAMELRACIGRKLLGK